MAKKLRQTILFSPENSVGEQRIADKIDSLSGTKLQEWLRKALIVGLAIENGNPACFEMMATYAQLESTGTIDEEKLITLLSTFSNEKTDVPEPAPKKEVEKAEVKADFEEIAKEVKPPRRRVRLGQ